MVYRDFRSNRGDQVLSEELKQTLLHGAAESFDEEVGSGQSAPQEAGIDQRVSPPYDQFAITQGPHGFSYGHMAIDISAGKGAIIKSPIQGFIADLYTDQYGNPTLVIENDFYRVTMLHGKYKVSIGDQISRGQMVGRESNLGLTTDMRGRSCQGRNCGYHTHLNIFDKQLGKNVNPLGVIEQ